MYCRRFGFEIPPFEVALALAVVVALDKDVNDLLLAVAVVDWRMDLDTRDRN